MSTIQINAAGLNAVAAAIAKHPVTIEAVKAAMIQEIEKIKAQTATGIAQNVARYNIDKHWRFR